MALITLQPIFQDALPADEQTHPLPAHVRKAARAIMQCRTAALGGPVQECPDGQVSRIWDNACRHRSCPPCASLQTERWLALQQARLLARDHSHGIFTLPHDLNPLWLANVPVMSTLLFQAVRETLSDLLADPTSLGAQPGIIAALHTWSQTLVLHPHLHCLVTGGGWTALDQGERLAALAARHCQPYPQVRVVSCAFEAWQDVPGSYDLFLSAQALHWIVPAYGLVRAAELLKTGGTIALVWTLDQSQGSAFWQATEPIYNTYNPVDSSPKPPGSADLYRHGLHTSREFVSVHEVRTAWTKRYAGEEYLKLLQTFSDHRAMPEPNKSRFFEAIGRVIAQMGGEVIRHYETLALLAKKG